MLPCRCIRSILVIAVCVARQVSLAAMYVIYVWGTVFTDSTTTSWVLSCTWSIFQDFFFNQTFKVLLGMYVFGPIAGAS